MKRTVIVILLSAVCLCLGVNEPKSALQQKLEKERLSALEQYVKSQYQAIEWQYQRDMNLLGKRAADLAERFGIEKIMAWVEYADTLREANYNNDYTWNVIENHKSVPIYKYIGGRTYFVELYRRAELRDGLGFRYLFDRMTDFLSSYESQLIIEGILRQEQKRNSRNPFSDTLVDEAKRLLNIMKELIAEKQQIETRRLAAIESVEFYNADIKKQVDLTVAGIDEQTRQSIGTVIAIIDADKTPGVMIEGFDRPIVYAGEKLGDVKVVAISPGKVIFGKGRRTWTQKIGQTPEKYWQ